MTERSFILAYLMGRYHYQQETGEALWDVPFVSIHPSKRELEQAKNQYQEFIRLYIHTGDKKPLHQLDRALK